MTKNYYELSNRDRRLPLGFTWILPSSGLLRSVGWLSADLRAMKITNWRTRIQDKLAWKKIVEQAKTHPGL